MWDQQGSRLWRSHPFFSPWWSSHPSISAEKLAEGFDPVYMTKLYELGLEMAAKGYPWMKTPTYYLHD
jgi:hypothetical protein